jgi:ATP-dependent Clp protease ATP-binding subunit ClpA
MFERFTDRARGAVVLAQEEARILRHGYVGTEHLLLGVLRDEGCAGARALGGLGVGLEGARSDILELVGRGPTAPLGASDAEALDAIGIDLDEVRRRVEETFGEGALERRVRRGRRGRRGRSRGGDTVSGHIPLTAGARKSLELSLREALRLGHRHIGTEHLVLGLVRVADGIAAQVLAARGASPDRVCGAVIAEISRGGDAPGRSA